MDRLPFTAAADLRGNEFGWRPQDFPWALKEAARLGFRCIGGQFQFRLPDGPTCEMYWLDADAPHRLFEESWSAFVSRCEVDVRAKFEQRLQSIDFRHEAEDWECIRQLMTNGKIDPLEHVYFVAYFEDENGKSV